jgi:hypothetical protein
MRDHTLRFVFYQVFACCLIVGTTLSYGAPLPLTDREWLFICQRNSQALKTGICEVHSVAMKKMSVPIRYGLPAGPGPCEPTYVYRMLFFPHAEMFVEGGGVPITNRTTEEVLICNKCKDAEKNYLLHVDKTE